MTNRPARRRRTDHDEVNGSESTLLHYTLQQNLVTAVYLISFWKRPWFDDLFPNDPYLSRLLIGICVGGENGSLLSLTEASKLMQVTDSRTANRYVDKAVDHGLLDKQEKAAAGDNLDKRRILLKPTPKLVVLVKQELAKVTDEFRNVIAAMLKDGQQLPETGAAQLMLTPPESDAPNRSADNYAERADARAKHSSIGWQV